MSVKKPVVPCNRFDMVGLFFHTFDGKEFARQGQIVCLIHEEYYLCQLYDWMVGAPSTKVIMHIKDFVGGNLYDSSEEMKEEYEYCHVGKH